MAIKNRAGFTCPGPVPPTVDWFAGIAHRSGVIIWLARKYGWTRGAELGLWQGDTMSAVLGACPDMHMIGVDLWQEQPGNEGPEDWVGWGHEEHERDCRRRVGVFGDRATIIKDWTVAAAEQVAAASLDFVFIDADHSEESTRADILAWGPKIKPGGMMLGHDISWPSVKAAVDDLLPGYWIGPDVTWGRVWQPV